MAGKLNKSERSEADKGHAKREEMPGSAFLEPNSRKYPVKINRDGEWKYDADLLLAAEREAEMHGHADLAARAKEIRKREFAQDSVIAVDRSARSIDADGRLHVSMSNISKATVNPYYGREIPGYDSLGLSPDKIYNMLRDPKELEKGADTFNNLQLLSRHVPVSAADPQKDIVVGSTGTDAQFVAPYLRNSLVIWDAEAIAGIETRDQCELSCAYRYVPVMTPGTFEGTAYDGVMTQIVGNHVALVEVGRAGPDVMVSDANPFNPPEKSNMKQRNRKTIAVRAAVRAYLRPQLAADASMSINELVGAVKAATIAQDAARISAAVKSKVPAVNADDLKAVVMDAAAEEDDEDTEAEDDDETEEERKKREAEEAAKKAEDEEESERKKDEAAGGRKANAERDDKKAMDAAINKARADATASAVARMNAIRQAEKDVQPIVGEIAAMDSAEAIYKMALDHAGVPTDGVHPSAFPSLVKMHLSMKAAKPVIAQDAKTASSFWGEFKNVQLPARS